MRKISVKRILPPLALILFLSHCPAAAVTSHVTRHNAAADFLKGQTENAVIDSEGTIQLARQATEIDCQNLLRDVWMINTIVSDNSGILYLGTSPNGKIIKYDNGKAEQIHPLEESSSQTEDSLPADSNSSEPKAEFTNEHIFAMALDKAGRLLAAVSGSTCRVLRFENTSVETLFAPDDATYIFAITLDEIGNIYLATGPQGRIYRLDPFGQNPQLIYTSRDKNILSLALDKDGYIYAGSDQRGIIYKIDQNSKTAVVLYDSEQTEVTALLLDDLQNVYAAATSADAVKNKASVSSIAKDSGTGRPDTETNQDDDGNDGQSSDTVELKTANTSKENEIPQRTPPVEAKRGALPKSAGHIYKINPEGFVTDVFTEMAVFFDLEYHNQKLLLATGNNAQLFTIDPETEKKEIAYEDKQASQITALTTVDKNLYLGCANPAKLIRLEQALTSSGHYTSDLIDASQPAKWGKLQIDADIPQGCKILLSTRSGNVKDPNDPTFSHWTAPVEVTEATQLDCPNARFCQYKLTLESSADNASPIIREVAVAHVIPNLPPQIRSITITRPKDKKKSYMLQINYKAEDDNKDALIYTLEFRKLGRNTWIELKDELAAATFDWDTNTVEDGRYELRLTASDKRSNTTTTSMTAHRISDSFVVDNTAPKTKSEDIDINGTTLKLNLTVEDALSAIGNVSYTINSNADWTSTLPDDMVYDTITEDFTVVLEDMEKNEHVIALKISDDLGNTMYKTYSIEIE
jgi:hypothetical protein